ncbi:response regulator [Lignipirellula cremea]|nr:response regulator [Lignipirellula cremea]
MRFDQQAAAVILVVDSDALTLTGVAAALHLTGHEAHCARDREAALKAVRALSLDLVICDIDMPGPSGKELWRELQSEPNMADTPVIFVTDSPSQDIMERVQIAGGCYYLRKPYDPNVLLELVDKALWLPHLVSNHLSSGRMESIPRPNAIAAANRDAATLPVNS